MLNFIMEFLKAVFGSFWSNLMGGLMKVLIGPAAFFMFGPIFDLSGYVAEFIFGRIVVSLGDDIGVNFMDYGAWIAECLRLQECFSAYITFLCMGFTLSLIKKIV